MKLPMNADIYSIGFVFETIWRRIVGGATGTRATIIKWPLGGLSNLFIIISDFAILFLYTTLHFSFLNIFLFVLNCNKVLCL